MPKSKFQKSGDKLSERTLEHVVTMKSQDSKIDRRRKTNDKKINKKDAR